VTPPVAEGHGRIAPPRSRRRQPDPARGRADGRNEQAVLRCLGRAVRPLSPIDIARETQLSTLLVVPALGRLLSQGLVGRRPRPGGGGWEYQVTGRGRRQQGVAS
jgi:hypothetical protein